MRPKLHGAGGRPNSRLEDIVSVSVTHWLWGDEGWTFALAPRVTPDPVFGADKLYQRGASA